MRESYLLGGRCIQFYEGERIQKNELIAAIIIVLFITIGAYLILNLLYLQKPVHVFTVPLGMITPFLVLWGAFFGLCGGIIGYLIATFHKKREKKEIKNKPMDFKYLCKSTLLLIGIILFIILILKASTFLWVNDVTPENVRMINSGNGSIEVASTPSPFVITPSPTPTTIINNLQNERQAEITVIAKDSGPYTLGMKTCFSGTDTVGSDLIAWMESPKPNMVTLYSPHLTPANDKAWEYCFDTTDLKNRAFSEGTYRVGGYEFTGVNSLTVTGLNAEDIHGIQRKSEILLVNFSYPKDLNNS